MVESQSLQLMQRASQLNDVMTHHISQRLIAKGHTSLTPSLLSFLSTLECGVNFGSDIARKLGVTRQMVAKTVKELCRLGYLEQVQGTGRQKEILFTERGEQLMSEARALLSELDNVLLNSAHGEKISQLINALSHIYQVVEKQTHS
ncbi:HTH domain-containing protein [Pseudoalteromonas sp. OOF1S-7]|uniref:MarR family winged helix-turn-helix transcriptional regulator n=1 Tax=Pseudoalteromonas sp. OOF1S-7 TaxID=2917757 RepID=UPI001EF54406|nr:HTH domain-containing protein [Pseudoalteromonas sp. OOF1S-7]MCG7536524.1 MarR family transcriptional regulator [Pseudoalteromonas sp. OOF1S-7]